ncbi:MAG: acyl-CoA dehydrogenase [Pseudomonadota bacterium]
MVSLVFFLLCIGVASVLAIKKLPLWSWAIFIAVVTLILHTGFFDSSPDLNILSFIFWLPALLLGALCVSGIRHTLFIKPAFKFIKNILPKVSATEQEALDAGTVGWDAELFSGEPDWSKLKAIAPITLNEEEQNFLDGPTQELCKMLDDWSIRHTHNEVPDHIWSYMKDKGFFGMLISKEHGGLGFSAQAQSLVLGKLASRSPDACIIVMVPNSLGPGELIEKYGTNEQKQQYLPKLSAGEEMPCFALTGPTSGSDAASMRDIGIVCKGQHNGQEVVGIKLTWDKRYITLAPKATLLGLAFRLFDPDNLLGKKSDIGITLAMIPHTHPGVNIGRRHLPSGTAFPNGPTSGKDVFIPMEWVIGGQDYIGKGWSMLMSCLSAGRSISLPASGTAGVKYLLRVTSAYARTRKQFGLAIGRMEGVEDPLARLVENAYVAEASRAVTASMVSAGEKPSVISALLKYQSTERMRQSVNDAMDIHAGKAICDGPSNYLLSSYQMVPVGITVEGANILTRTLITFSQGALRSHPWLYREIQAVQDPDEERGLRAFEKAFVGHITYTTSNIFGALFHNITFGFFADTPSHASTTNRHYAQLYRASKNFALVADLTVALLGGGLKVRQKISGRLADALSELYMISCVLKRYEDDGEQLADATIVDYCVQNSLYRFQEALKGVVDNFPIRGVAWLLAILLFPLGARKRPAPDKHGKELVKQVLEPGEMRDRLTRHIFVSHDANDTTGLLEVALQCVVASEAADKKVEKAVRKGLIQRYHNSDWLAEAVQKSIITQEEETLLRKTEDLVSRVIAVDHFTPAEVLPNYATQPMTNTNTEAAE